MKKSQSSAAIFLCFFLSSSAYAQSLEDAKKQFLKSDRKGALVMLDALLKKNKNKKEELVLNSKKNLFFEQFFTAESFQRFQAAKVLLEAERASDCVREIEKIPVVDQDNKFVLLMRAECLKTTRAYDEAEKSVKAVILFEPELFSAVFALSEINLLQGKAKDALAFLEHAVPTTGAQTEQVALLKAKALVSLEKSKEALEVLKTDYEKNIDHANVLYELGVLSQSQPSGEWLARKYYSLFLSRCKRMDGKKKEIKLESSCAAAKDALQVLEQKLGNAPSPAAT